jgi:hypothetical protein
MHGSAPSCIGDLEYSGSLSYPDHGQNTALLGKHHVFYSPLSCTFVHLNLWKFLAARQTDGPCWVQFSPNPYIASCSMFSHHTSECGRKVWVEAVVFSLGHGKTWTRPLWKTDGWLGDPDQIFSPLYHTEVKSSPQTQARKNSSQSITERPSPSKSALRSSSLPLSLRTTLSSS